MTYRAKPRTPAVNLGSQLTNGLQLVVPFTQGKTQFLYPYKWMADWAPTNPAFTTSPFGQCPNFNNDTGLDLGNPIQFQGNAGAFGIWFKTSDSSQQYSTMISKNGAWALYNNFGILKGWVYGAGAGSGFVNTGVNIADGKWHSVIYNFSVGYGTCAIYLDGKQVVQQAYSIRDQFTQARIGIETGADNFIGALDMPVIWNRFLTPQDIQQYNANPCQIFVNPTYAMGKVSAALTGNADITFGATGMLSELFGEGSMSLSGTGIMGDFIASGSMSLRSTGELVQLAEAGGTGSMSLRSTGNLLRSYLARRYADLIPPPNSIAPKFMLWVNAALQPWIDDLNFTSQFIDAFFLQRATGDQLDILGTILGQGRVVNFTPTLPEDSPILDDENYRIVLTAKIMLNQWRGTKQEVYDFWTKFFPQYPLIIQDNQDMSMDVQVVGMADGIQLDLVNNGYFVPKPAGVRINFSQANQPIFAYDFNTDTLKGYDQGYWADGV